MTTELPIVCTLGAGDYRQRLADLTALGQTAFRAAERAPGRAVLRFAPGAHIHEQLDAIVAAEARCCAFLTLTVSAASDAITLTIDGPIESEPVLAALTDALSGQPEVARR